MGSDQTNIDARIQSYYGGVFDEHARLTTRSAQGPLEFARTQELIRDHVPTGARIADIGGGAGIHSRALMDAGYDAVLLDPVPRHVEQAHDAGVTAAVGDARVLPWNDAEFDAAIMLGPLYHLASGSDRQLALAEARRVVRPGGVLLAAGLSRYVALGQVMLGRPVPSELPTDWAALIAEGHPASGMRFPAGHFHTAEELEAEMVAAGLRDVSVVGVEGPAGLFLETLTEADADVRAAAMTLARATAGAPGIRDFSAHLLAIGRV